MFRLSAVAIVFLSSVLSSCVFMDNMAKPAVLTVSSADNAKQKVLIDDALSKLLFAPVHVSDTVFSQKSLLLLEAHSPKDNQGKLLDDNIQKAALPEQIELFKLGDTCFLKRFKTGKRITLEGVACKVIEL